MLGLVMWMKLYLSGASIIAAEANSSAIGAVAKAKDVLKNK